MFSYLQGGQQQHVGKDKGVPATYTASASARSLRPPDYRRLQTDGNASKLTDSAILHYADMRSAVASNQPSLGMDSACKLRLWISAIASAVVELGRSPGSSGVHTDGWH